MIRIQYQKLICATIFAIILVSSNSVIIDQISAQSPPKFLWGAATASYQSEGEINNNDWEKFTRSSIIRDRVLDYSNIVKDPLHLQPAGDAVKFADPRYYTADFDKAVAMGMNTFRIGIEWAHIEPQKDHWNMAKINEYKQMISVMREKGLTPVVTLNHFTLPSWMLTPPTNNDVFNNVPANDPFYNSLKGWENEKTIDEFVDYVSFVVSNLEDQVDYWLTLNEPVSTYIGTGYVGGVWPPGFILHGFAVRDVLHNQILAHVKAYDKITAIDNVDSDGDGKSKRVSFTHWMAAVKAKFDPFGPFYLLNLEAADNVDYFLHDYFLNAVVFGIEDINFLNTNPPERGKKLVIHDKPGDDWRNKIDFVAPQYYRLAEVYHDPIVAQKISYWGGRFDNIDNNFPGFKSDLGWPIYPEGFYQVLMKIKNQWNKPILVTENGIADSDGSKRPKFITSHLQQLENAIDDGANVFGYLHWSMTDNFEWAYNYEPKSKFGLFSIDRDGRELISDRKFHAAPEQSNGIDVINPGMSSSLNCVIDTVILELLDRNGKIVATNSKGERPATATSSAGTQFGAIIVESNENTNNLETKVAWFYQFGNAVRYQLHYLFKGQDCDRDNTKLDLPRQKTRGADAYELIIKGSDSGIPTDKAIDRAVKKYGTYTSDGEGIILSEKDITPPSVFTPSSPIIAEATGPSGTRVTFEVSADDDQDFPINATCNPPSGSIFPLGDTEVMCQAQDSSGNIGISKFIVRIQDTTPPDTRILEVKDGNNLILRNGDETVSNKIMFSFDGSDMVGVKGFECSLDNAPFSTCTSPTSYEKLGFANHNVQVRAGDTSGNKDPTPAVFTWKVLTPKQATEKLLSTVNGLTGVNSAVKTSLAVQLNQAIKVLGDRNTSNDKLACIYLGSFITSVNAYKTTGLLTTSQADNLKQQAQAIQKANGCGNSWPGITGGIVMPF